MLKSVFMSYGIMLILSALSFILLPVPVVHFAILFVIPLSPFVGSYIIAKKRHGLIEATGSFGLKFGLIMGVLAAVTIVISALVLSQIMDLERRTQSLLWIAIFIGPLYVGSMSALGTMYGILKSKKTIISP
ncbi:MAG TPA: hypothetical protein DEZ08_02095 [Dehalococcoidia bacterium]|jgi:hypothetical protein|nr:hypothetical protein [Dehalococcoidia bacterium]